MAENKKNGYYVLTKNVEAKQPYQHGIDAVIKYASDAIVEGV